MSWALNKLDMFEEKNGVAETEWSYNSMGEAISHKEFGF